AIPTLVAVAGLLFSNAYSDPKIRRPSKLLFQCVASLSLAFLVEVALFYSHPGFAVPFGVMLQGSSMSVALVFSIRMLFRPVLGRPKFAPWTEYRPLPVLKG